MRRAHVGAAERRDPNVSELLLLEQLPSLSRGVIPVSPFFSVSPGGPPPAGKKGSRPGGAKVTLR